MRWRCCFGPPNTAIDGATSPSFSGPGVLEPRQPCANGAQLGSTQSDRPVCEESSPAIRPGSCYKAFRNFPPMATCESFQGRPQTLGDKIFPLALSEPVKTNLADAFGFSVTRPVHFYFVPLESMHRSSNSHYVRICLDLGVTVVKMRSS